jgi:hypothetical protein
MVPWPRESPRGVIARTALRTATMLRDWNLLSDELQLALSTAALHRAAETIAGQAELLAGEMEAGTLTDRGGADALRLLALVVRETGRRDAAPAGHA